MSGPHPEFAYKKTDGGLQGSRPKISLIVATCNRVSELERLLASLEEQTYKNFEVVVVDQNRDDRLVPLLQKHDGLAIRHLRSELGVSRARNAGLRVCAGELVAFPDDDCWYPDQLLAEIVKWFEAHPDFDGLLTAIRNPASVAMVPKFPPRPGPCTRKSVLRCAASVNTFWRGRLVKQVGFFAEDLGLGSGSQYQSGEDLEYAIRSLGLGFHLCYEPAFTVYHPEISSKERLRKRAYSYAMGVGHVWQIHGYPWWWCLGEIVMRSLGGSVFQLCKGDPQRSYIYLLRAAGQFRGFISRSKEVAAGSDVHPMADDHA